MSEEQNLTPLAPSGLSAHNHEVEYSQSGLALHWVWDRKEHLRKFTPEETYHLLKILEQHKAEIEQAYTEWGKPKATCMECGKPLSSDQIYTHTTVGVRFVYCADCYRSQFD